MPGAGVEQALAEIVAGAERQAVLPLDSVEIVQQPVVRQFLVAWQVGDHLVAQAEGLVEARQTLEEAHDAGHGLEMVFLVGTSAPGHWPVRMGNRRGSRRRRMARAEWGPVTVGSRRVRAAPHQLHCNVPARPEPCPECGAAFAHAHRQWRQLTNVDRVSTHRSRAARRSEKAGLVG